MVLMCAVSKEYSLRSLGQLEGQLRPRTVLPKSLNLVSLAFQNRSVKTKRECRYDSQDVAEDKFSVHASVWTHDTSERDDTKYLYPG